MKKLKVIISILFFFFFYFTGFLHAVGSSVKTSVNNHIKLTNINNLDSDIFRDDFRFDDLISKFQNNQTPSFNVNTKITQSTNIDDISGQIYANVIIIPTLNTTKNNILSRLKRSYFSVQNSSYKRNIWSQWCNNYNLYKINENPQENFKVTSNGIQTGFDTLKDDEQIFGLTFGFIDTKSMQNENIVNIKGYNIGGYGSVFFNNNFEMRLLIIGGRQNYSSIRNISNPVRNTTAEFKGLTFNAAGELSYNHYFRDNFCLQPFTGIDYSYVFINDFTENCSDSFGLTVLPEQYNRTNTTLGIQINSGTNMKIKCYMEIKANILLIGQEGNIKSKLNNEEEYVYVKSIKNDMLNTELSTGLFYDISSFLSFYINISSIISYKQTSYYGNIGLNFKFTTTPLNF
jgi:outer membrane autotransporter protein